MIARTWHGQTDAEHADEYIAHLKGSVVPELEGIDGYRGIHVLRRETDDGVDFGVLTFWDSMDAIRVFAGEDPETAVVAADARAVLLCFDAKVRHHEVVIGPEKA